MKAEPESRLKIAVSIWMFVPGTGGLQGHAECLVRHLIRQGHDVTVITRAYKRVPEGMGFLYDHDAERETEVDGIPVRTIQYPRLLRPLHWLIGKLIARPALKRIGVGLFRLQAQIGNQKCFKGFDIIHHVGQATALVGFVAADAARSLATPFVVQPTCHPHDVGDSPTDIALYRNAKRVLVHTRYEKNFLATLLPGIPFDVVANGIENRVDGNGQRFRNANNLGSAPVILFAGRRSRQKGYSLAVNAFKKLSEENSTIRLVCIGPDGECERYESEKVLNFGFVDEQTKHDAIAACDILCVPSEGESFGLIYMEAGLYGKPVVARRLPVLEELLEHGEAGLLIGTLHQSKNSNTATVDNVVVALRAILEDENLQQKLRTKIKAVANNFVWENVVTKFERSYFDSLR
jgi:glycosyltransferase involved in cell wall biosynthesis